MKRFADEGAEAREGEESLLARIKRRGAVEPQSLLAEYAYGADDPVAASTAPVDITTGGVPEIDGIQTAPGDLVFLKDQSDPKENGFWEVQTGGWNRYAGNTASEADKDRFTPCYSGQGGHPRRDGYPKGAE